MAGRYDAKLKLLYLLDILSQYSDEEHPLDAGELIAHLEEAGISAERKSVYRDVEVLRSFGLDVIATRTPKPGYFLGERKLQLAEIRLLMDAVLSAGFITPKKSRELIGKLKEMCSCYQAKALEQQIYIDKRVKHKNEEIYYTIDIINRAISHQRQISFEYGRRILLENGKIGWNLKKFTVSPYALLWLDDNYYVIGNHSKYQNLMHLRVDRMLKVKMTDHASRSFEEVSPYRNHFDVADYAGKLAGAFGGKPMVMEVLCESGLLEQILDRFGDQITIRNRPDGRFSFRTEMAISDGLVRDIIALGPGVQVLSPKVLRQKIEQTVEQLHQLYQTQ